MHLYKTARGAILVDERQYYLVEEEWDQLINQQDLYGHLDTLRATSRVFDENLATDLIQNYLLPPIGSQEVWAAGVTYLRSRDARMDESKESGAADCYQKVYEAQRPELFFKALPHRVVGHGQEVYIRKDSEWDVPEPELTLYINSKGNIQAYTVGNDMSSRSIEGENPLYLPQAKIYDRSAGLGPCLLITKEPISLQTQIFLEIHREGKNMYNASAPISRMKRSLTELVDYLFSECEFIHGVFLMTGTCLVPPNDFSLKKGDVVSIKIDGIGTLRNTVAMKAVPELIK